MVFIRRKHALRAAVCLMLVGVMVLPCVSCGLNVSALELSSGYSRKATSQGEVTDDFKASMADFSLKLFKGLVTKDGKNDLVSPLSAIICLAMIANGADGNTKTQMEEAFGMDIETLNECLYAFTSSLYHADDCKFSIADSIWFRNEENRLHVNEDFLQTNADWYNAQIYSAKFDSTTLDDINAWCKRYTDGLIDKMIDEISDDDVMYLVNALVFDAKWEVKYEKENVNDGVFTNYGGGVKTVQMLSSGEQVYISSGSARGFAKNYAGGRYSMVGLLPDEGMDVYDYIDSLTGGEWLEIWESRISSSVAVKMPEFTYSLKMNLNDTLKSMGMIDMFASAADFSKLGYSERGNIYCSDVDQKVFIQVDRSGTKAAAITWGTMKDECAPMFEYEVILDRPFVYAIVDNATGLPMFIGAVTNF